MLPADLNDLKNIHDFPSLVAYLGERLEWPLEANDIDDLTFEYEAKELGLEPQHAVKLRSIKQLRPLTDAQPWGVFYLEFEPKRLPVVVLRRILRELVPKKRQTAATAERAVWNKHDLLFISSMGEQSHRRISFAHFADGEDNLPLLQAFDWDDRETQFAAINLSLEKLKWPDNAGNVEAWRQAWAGAFTKPHGYSITTAKELSHALAVLAGRIRDTVKEIYGVEASNGPLHALFTAFQKALVHDLEPDGFADTIAQTIAYGLFAAKAEMPLGQRLGLTDLADMIPATNPFLRELFREIEKLGGAGAGSINFDELGVAVLVAVLNRADMGAILADFGRQTGGGREDPVIHFYEAFLREYDKKQKVERGVFYTPKPVVSFIVRSVDQILREQFACPDGLADTSTWAQLAERVAGVQIPNNVAPNTPFVQILDPAVGTGTFLETVIEVVYETLSAKWAGEKKTKDQIQAAWNEYVPKHLLPRLNGFELMMASYAIAHVKLGLALKQRGYDFQSGERLRVFLTNTLEPPTQGDKQLAFLPEFLSHESFAADTVKRDTPVTVVVGNPPYSYASSNNGAFISDLIRDYYQVDGKPLDERNPRGLQDDYVKFIRIGQWYIDKTATGVLGYITNHSYFDNPTFRGMRQNLLGSFNNVDVIDLHGNSKKKERSPDGVADENVFDIQQGVGIGILFQMPCQQTVVRRHTHLWGSRETKYKILADINSSSSNQIVFQPKQSQYYFLPQDTTLLKEYEQGTPITEVMASNTVGLYTARDEFAIRMTPKEVLDTVSDFASINLEEARVKYRLGDDSRDWQVGLAQKDVRLSGSSKANIVPIAYRPFDVRYTYFTGISRGYMCMPRAEVMRHLRKQNLALCFMRRSREQVVSNFWVAKHVTDKTVLSSADNANVAPLYLYSKTGANRQPNISQTFLTIMYNQLGLTLAEPRTAASTDIQSGDDLTPELGMFTEFHGVFAASDNDVNATKMLWGGYYIM